MSDGEQFTDALGTALYDYYNDDTDAKCTIYREDGFRDAVELSAYFTEYGEWRQLTKDAVHEIHSGPVVDLGCGTGRHLRYLQRQGFDSVGIDISHNLIDIAVDRGSKNCMVMDVNDTAFAPETFGSVLMVGEMIGMGDRVAVVKDRLEELAKVTKPDARLVADSQDPFYTKKREHAEYYERNQIGDRKVSKVRFRVEYGDVIGDWIDLLFFSPSEVETVVQDTPWTVVKKLYPDDRSNWYSLNNGWYFVVLEKS